MPFTKNQKRTALFSVKRIRHGHQFRVQHSGMTAQKRLDFFRADLLATAIDVVAQAPFERKVGHAVDDMRAHHVPGPEETVRRKGRGVGLWGVVVTSQARRTAKT